MPQNAAAHRALVGLLHRRGRCLLLAGRRPLCSRALAAPPLAGPHSSRRVAPTPRPPPWSRPRTRQRLGRWPPPLLLAQAAKAPPPTSPMPASAAAPAAAAATGGRWVCAAMNVITAECEQRGHGFGADPLLTIVLGALPLLGFRQLLGRLAHRAFGLLTRVQRLQRPPFFLPMASSFIQMVLLTPRGHSWSLSSSSSGVSLARTRK